MERAPVPFFRPSIGEAEEREVLATLRSGWLTTGERCRRFEEAFARALGVRHAIALSSCAAALHRALDAVWLERGEAVLVPTHTFAATAEVVRYFDALPVFVDCEPVARTVLRRRAPDSRFTRILRRIGGRDRREPHAHSSCPGRPPGGGGNCR